MNEGNTPYTHNTSDTVTHLNAIEHIQDLVKNLCATPRLRRHNTTPHKQSEVLRRTKSIFARLSCMLDKMRRCDTRKQRLQRNGYTAGATEVLRVLCDVGWATGDSWRPVFNLPLGSSGWVPRCTAV